MEYREKCSLAKLKIARWHLGLYEPHHSNSFYFCIHLKIKYNLLCLYLYLCFCLFADDDCNQLCAGQIGQNLADESAANWGKTSLWLLVTNLLWSWQDTNHRWSRRVSKTDLFINAETPEVSIFFDKKGEFFLSKLPFKKSTCMCLWKRLVLSLQQTEVKLRNFGSCGARFSQTLNPVKLVFLKS